MFFITVVALAMLCWAQQGRSNQFYSDTKELKQNLNSIIDESMVEMDAREYFESLSIEQKLDDGKNTLNKLVANFGKVYEESLAAVERLRSSVEIGYETSFYSSIVTSMTSWFGYSRSSCCLSQETYKMSDMIFSHTACELTAPSTPYFASKVANNFEKASILNVKTYPSIKRQYFGSVEGRTTVFPASKDPNCKNFDSRYRPWYVEAFNGQKRQVVLIIDNTESLYNSFLEFYRNSMRKLKKMAKTYVMQLKPYDQIAVLLVAGNENKKRSFHINMLLATGQNKKEIINYIEAIQPQSKSDFSTTFRKAFSFYQESYYTNADDETREIVFLSAGRKNDHIPDVELKNVIAYFTKQRVNQIKFTIGKTTGNDPHLEMLLGINSFAHEGLKLDEDLAALVPKKINVKSPSWTFPYLDAWGSGQVISASAPVYQNEVLIGVVGLDILLDNLFGDSEVYSDDFSYAFLIDQEGHALKHPLLQKNDETDLNLVDIASLERDPQFQSIIEPMKRDESGKTQIYTERLVSTGNHHNYVSEPMRFLATYIWRRVPNTKYTIAVVVSSDPVINMKPDAHLPVNSLQFHTFDFSPPKHPCTHYNNYATMDKSSLYLAPRAFLKESDQEDKQIQSPVDLQNLLSYLSKFGQNNLLLKDGIKEDIIASNHLQELWLNKHNSYESNVIWRHFTTPSGVFRIYPGIKISNGYDPTLREWYQQSVAFKDQGTIITTPYRDLASHQIVITMAEAIYKSSSYFASRNTYTKLFGVTAQDIRVDYFQRMLFDWFPSCQDFNNWCYLMDHSGFLIVSNMDNFSNPHLKPIRDHKKNAVKHHLIDFAQHVSLKLMENNILRIKNCSLIASGCSQRVYQMEKLTTPFKHSFKNGSKLINFHLIPVDRTNTYLLVINTEKKSDGLFMKSMNYNKPQMQEKPKCTGSYLESFLTASPCPVNNYEQVKLFEKTTYSALPKCYDTTYKNIKAKKDELHNSFSSYSFYIKIPVILLAIFFILMHFAKKMKTKNFKGSREKRVKFADETTICEFSFQECKLPFKLKNEQTDNRRSILVKKNKMQASSSKSQKHFQSKDEKSNFVDIEQNETTFKKFEVDLNENWNGDNIKTTDDKRNDVGKSQLDGECMQKLVINQAMHLKEIEDSNEPSDILSHKQVPDNQTKTEIEKVKTQQNEVKDAEEGEFVKIELKKAQLDKHSDFEVQKSDSKVSDSNTDSKVSKSLSIDKLVNNNEINSADNKKSNLCESKCPKKSILTFRGRVTRAVLEYRERTPSLESEQSSGFDIDRSISSKCELIADKKDSIKNSIKNIENDQCSMDDQRSTETLSKIKLRATSKTGKVSPTLSKQKRICLSETSKETEQEILEETFPSSVKKEEKNQKEFVKKKEGTDLVRKKILKPTTDFDMKKENLMYKFEIPVKINSTNKEESVEKTSPKSYSKTCKKELNKSIANNDIPSKKKRSGLRKPRVKAFPKLHKLRRAVDQQNCSIGSSMLQSVDEEKDEKSSFKHTKTAISETKEKPNDIDTKGKTLEKESNATINMQTKINTRKADKEHKDVKSFLTNRNGDEKAKTKSNVLVCQDGEIFHESTTTNPDKSVENHRSTKKDNVEVDKKTLKNIQLEHVERKKGDIVNQTLLDREQNCEEKTENKTELLLELGENISAKKKLTIKTCSNLYDKREVKICNDNVSLLKEIDEKPSKQNVLEAESLTLNKKVQLQKSEQNNCYNEGILDEKNNAISYNEESLEEEIKKLNEELDFTDFLTDIKNFEIEMQTFSEQLDLTKVIEPNQSEKLTPTDKECDKDQPPRLTKQIPHPKKYQLSESNKKLKPSEQETQQQSAKKPESLIKSDNTPEDNDGLKKKKKFQSRLAKPKIFLRKKDQAIDYKRITEKDKDENKVKIMENDEKLQKKKDQKKHHITGAESKTCYSKQVVDKINNSNLDQKIRAGSKQKRKMIEKVDNASSSSATNKNLKMKSNDLLDLALESFSPREKTMTSLLTDEENEDFQEYVKNLLEGNYLFDSSSNSCGESIEKEKAFGNHLAENSTTSSKEDAINRLLWIQEDENGADLLKTNQNKNVCYSLNGLSSAKISNDVFNHRTETLTPTDTQKASLFTEEKNENFRKCLKNNNQNAVFFSPQRKKSEVKDLKVNKSINETEIVDRKKYEKLELEEKSKDIFDQVMESLSPSEKAMTSLLTPEETVEFEQYLKDICDDDFMENNFFSRKDNSKINAVSINPDCRSFDDADIFRKSKYSNFVKKSTTDETNKSSNSIFQINDVESYRWMINCLNEDVFNDFVQINSSYDRENDFVLRRTQSDPLVFSSIESITN